jgi:UDP-N-acetylmuramate dehydrogenase
MMRVMTLDTTLMDHLHEALGQRPGIRLEANALLARYSAARLGGPADLLLEVNSAEDLAQAVGLLWKLDQPFMILGGGSNVLISDLGVRGVVILNRARQVRFAEADSPPTVWAESGANFGLLARQAAQRGLGGLEWAAGIPGTIGGAVTGNAGAHGGDMAGNLQLAEILHHMEGAGKTSPLREEWPPERLELAYRSSILKRNPGKAVVLSVTLALERSTTAQVQKRMEEFSLYRRRTQPPGASMGSMFKNPPGNYAGRLIEAAGLKGTTIGGAEISGVHANFFLNRGEANASEVRALIELARREVARQFGIQLELEIELIGEWPNQLQAA